MTVPRGSAPRTMVGAPLPALRDCRINFRTCFWHSAATTGRPLTSMTDVHDPEVRRFLELLAYKIGFNALARVTVLEHANPLLRLVRYVTADAERESGSVTYRNRLGELTASAKIIDAIFQLALKHEESNVPFLDGKLVFYDVMDYRHENRRTFVIMFLHVNMI